MSVAETVFSEAAAEGSEKLALPANNLFPCCFSRTLERSRQTPKQIGSDQRVLTNNLAHHIASQPMQINRCTYGEPCLTGVLSNHPGNHSGKDVSRPSGRHSRIPSRADPSLAVRLHHERSISLEHNDHTVLARELPRHSQPIFLHIRSRTSGQTRHLTRMWRDYQRASLPVHLLCMPLECIQSIGVHHHRKFLIRDQRSHQSCSMRIARNPWSDGEHRHILQQFGDS